ncbi:MAG TPA: ATP-dependent Clp protease adapter ClpS [Thermoanaerobaculia bacterium]
MGTHDFEHDEAVLTETEVRVEKPPLYRVLLHNDDFTTMEFVVFILQTVFNRPPSEAFQLMMHVHMRGVGVAGIYTHEVAEVKVTQVMSLAGAHEYPLQCTMEEA